MESTTVHDPPGRLLELGIPPRTGRVGRWLGAGTALTATVALGVGVTTSPRSGPYCRADCIGYPYAGGAQYVPRDFWWMYPAALSALLAMVMIAGLPRRAGAVGGWVGELAVALAAIAAAVLVTDYAIQLTVVQPALVKGEAQGLGLVSQYNPHGLFIALENVGYLFLALAFLAAGVAMATESRIQRATRAVFLTGGSAAVAGLIVLALAYRLHLDYRFEVFGLSLDWLVLILTGALLAWRSTRPSDKQ
jgi:hypothetical protein